MAGKEAFVDGADRTVRPPPKVADAELPTPEHKTWALALKRRAGWRCEWVENGEGACSLGGQRFSIARTSLSREDVAKAAANGGNRD